MREAFTSAGVLISGMARVSKAVNSAAGAVSPPEPEPLSRSDLERFFYREARLLDERRYMEWLEVLDQAIRYVLLNRFVPAAQRQSGDEDASTAHAIAHETVGIGGRDNPLRDENHLQLLLRADRAKKSISWSDNPPPFTRRFVTNIEWLGSEHSADGNLHSVRSNLLLYYHRHGRRDAYTGQREDQLLAVGDSLRIRRREVLLDWDVITGPSVGLFF